MDDLPILLEMQRNCFTAYKTIEVEASQAEMSRVREDLPIRLAGPSIFEFPKAGSLAIQSLVPRQSSLQESLDAFRSSFCCEFPVVCKSTFWQPTGTLHLNVVILLRLALGEINEERYEEALKRADEQFRNLEIRKSYDTDFIGVMLAVDGTIMAKGRPNSLTPFEIRRAFIEAGFPDQQIMCHITLGRILQNQDAALWSRLQSFVKTYANCKLGTHRVERPILVKEHEGFLRQPSCYEVLRDFEFAAIS